jgi:C-terminal processing protease CtpA/Prc
MVFMARGFIVKINAAAKVKSLKMVENDAFRKANRAMRSAGADDRVVELRMPLGMELDEDENGNVFVKSIEKNGRADKSGMVFVGDYVAMASATFGEDMWSCRGVGLSRVLSVIKMRNTKPVRLVLEAANEAEEKKRRAIAFAEMTEEEKLLKKKVRISYSVESCS